FLQTQQSNLGCTVGSLYISDKRRTYMTDAYAKSGVHIDLANETIARYQSILERHVDPRVLKGVGGFSGCFALQGYRNAVLAASTDGVGTKVLRSEEDT